MYVSVSGSAAITASRYEKIIFVFRSMLPLLLLSTAVFVDYCSDTGMQREWERGGGRNQKRVILERYLFYSAVSFVYIIHKRMHALSSYISNIISPLIFYRSKLLQMLFLFLLFFKSIWCLYFILFFVLLVKSHFVVGPSQVPTFHDLA